VNAMETFIDESGVLIYVLKTRTVTSLDGC
jgi:hypothetical protein